MLELLEILNSFDLFRLLSERDELQPGAVKRALLITGTAWLLVIVFFNFGPLNPSGAIEVLLVGFYILVAIATLILGVQLSFIYLALLAKLARRRSLQGRTNDNQQ